CLVKNPFTARLYELQESDQQRTKPSHSAVLHKADGLHVLYHFLDDIKIQETLKWMRERLIFAWIEERDKRKEVENEMLHIVRTNCVGIGSIKTLKPKKDVLKKNETSYFNNHINWK